MNCGTNQKFIELLPRQIMRTQIQLKWGRNFLKDEWKEFVFDFLFVEWNGPFVFSDNTILYEGLDFLLPLSEGGFPSLPFFAVSFFFPLDKFFFEIVDFDKKFFYFFVPFFYFVVSPFVFVLPFLKLLPQLYDRNLQLVLVSMRNCIMGIYIL